MIGTSLSHYRITARLGAGGMGEVYRAEDVTLSRDVAIKVLPPNFASDPDRLARFEREAKLLASLNHPNVGAIHGFEDVEGTRFLVLELVEGEDLAERLSRGAIPVDEAIGIAKQIAEALEEAHAKGIVHRDLKPANVKLTPEGKVKVLDFGLAKAWAGERAGRSGSAVDLSQSPTLAHSGTQAGVILGSAGYMSPEQARGKPADYRADIWAFGVVLYEMLTGRRLFGGETVSDVLASVLRADIDLAVLPRDLPWRVRDLLERCLERDPRQRLHAAADARIGLSIGGEPPAVAAAATSRLWSGMAMAAALVPSVALGWVLLARKPEPARPIRLTMPVEPISERNAIAFSRDGQALAYAGGDANLLHYRPLGQLDAIPLSGTEGAQSPFFSPDGEWLAFFANGALKKVPVRGGNPVVLGQYPDPSSEMRGGVWSSDGRLFHSVVGLAIYPYATLFEVSAQGGEPRELLPMLDAEGKPSERVHPQLLPGERSLLFVLMPGDQLYGAEAASVQVLDLATGEVRTILEHHGFARYLPSGHLLASSGTDQFDVVPFDAATLQVTGSAVPLRDLIQSELDGVVAHLAHSATGSVAFVRSAPAGQGRGLSWLGLDGTATPLPIESREFEHVSVSPDGRRAVVAIGTKPARLWLYDFDREVLSALTTDAVTAHSPIWTPDGRAVIYQGEGGEIRRLSIDGGESELLTDTGTVWTAPWDVSPDGKTLAYFFWDPETEDDWDIRLSPLDGTADPTPFAPESSDELQPRFSPSGEWLAFASNRTGRYEIFCKRFPEAGALIQATDHGGRHPTWAPDGSRLFFLTEDRETLMAMDVTWTDAPVFGKPEKILAVPPQLRAQQWAPWGTLSSDGKRLLLIHRSQRVVRELTLILDWSSELRELAR